MLKHSKTIEVLRKQETLYEKIKQNCKSPLWRIQERDLILEILETFGPQIRQDRAERDLRSIYECAFHQSSGTLIIANKGATLYSLAPRTLSPYITRHIGLCLYIPEHGVEMVNVGLVGNVYEGPVVMRTESACTPSFLFGSQRCNCAHQWDVFREVVASFNPVSTPEIDCGDAFEKWVQSQMFLLSHQHIPRQSGQGFILLHIDTQNGMGSGYTPGEFSSDLFSRGSLRHRGEYTAEQVWQTTMAGGFEAIGLPPDPRKENNGSGYLVTPIVLDYLGCSKELVVLTNNPLKIKAIEGYGYSVKRIKSIGEVQAAGAKEAHERGCEFSHLDIDSTHVTFDEEFDRLCKEIRLQFAEEAEEVVAC